MPPTSPPHSARRRSRFRARALLGAVALSCAACSVPSHPSSTAAPRVLGQQSGTPVVVGQPAPAGTGQLSAVSCADTEHCWAVGSAEPDAAPAIDATGSAGRATTTLTVIAATADGGGTWATQRLRNNAPTLTGVSCPRATVCMAVGSTGTDPGAATVLTTRDGGRTWSPSTPPAGAIAVTSVRCSASSRCTVLATDGMSTWSSTTTDFGRSWQQEGTLPAGFAGAPNLSCDVAGTCLVAGFVPTTAGHGQGAVAISTDGGATWAAATVPPGVGLLQSATCASATACLAAGTTSTTVSDVVPAMGELLASDDGGHTWTTSPDVPPVDDVFGIDCPGVTACAMVGTKWQGSPPIGVGAVAESKDGGGTFLAATTAYTPVSLTALACPSAQHCVAVGGDTVARITLPLPSAGHSS